MTAKLVSDEEFIEILRTQGPMQTARVTGMHPRSVFQRRKRLEDKLNINLSGPHCAQSTARRERHPHRAQMRLEQGVVLVASDAHYWPGDPTLMHKALVSFCKELKPRALVLNGDVLDAPTISRHPPIGWEHRPDLADEIEAAQDRLHELEKAAGKAERVWNLGNHDARFETRLASVAPEYARVHGVHIQDHFPLWKPAWSMWINNDVVIKHRFKGGIHATHNNALWAGKSIITGHLHSAKVTPLSDYNGTRYGVDTGCIADPDAQAFVDYTEDAPKNWRSGFCVLTFKEGLLLQPELVLKFDEERIQFRGKVFRP